MTLDEMVVKIVLDATGFTKGQRDTNDALTKTKKEAVASGKVIEESMSKAGDAFLSVGRKALGLYALFTAGRGIKEFIADITGADAALGRTAKNLDMSAKSLSTWQGVADVAGGSAQGITGAMQSLSGAMQTAALTGANTLAPVFRALGVNLATTDGKARDVGDILVDLNRKSQGMDPARFSAMMGMIGIDPGTISLLEKSTEEFDRLRREQERYAATAADVDAAQKRQTGWRELLLTSTSLGRTILTSLTPAITGAMRAVQDWATANQEWIKSAIVEAVGQFVGWLKKVDWQALGVQFKDLGANVATIAEAFASVVKAVSAQSPLVVAFEAFAALLATRILAPLLTITKLIGGLSGVSLGGALAAVGGASFLANNTRDEQADNGFAMTAGERAMRFVDGGLADRVYGKRGEQQPHGPHHGVGVHAQAGEQKQDGFWSRAKRAVGRVFGGKDAPTAVNKDLTPEARALLDTIAGTESPGYNVEYGGKRFSSYADHPREGHPILSGPNVGKTSNAAGRYQFLSRTWDPIAKKYGLKDFSPENQDKGAWFLAQRDYRLRTGRTLDDDIKSKDPTVIAGIGHALRGTWTSLPGGIEAGTNGSKFASAFNHNLDRENKKTGAPVKVEVTDKSADSLGTHIARRTFGAYIGYAKQHTGDMPGSKAWNGIGRHHGLSAGSRAVAAINHARSLTNHSTHHEETHVGEMHVHPQTGDGRRFAGDFKSAARQRNSVVTQANAGLA